MGQRWIATVTEIDVPDFFTPKKINSSKSQESEVCWIYFLNLIFGPVFDEKQTPQGPDRLAKRNFKIELVAIDDHSS